MGTALIVLLWVFIFWSLAGAPGLWKFKRWQERRKRDA